MEAWILQQENGRTVFSPVFSERSSIISVEKTRKDIGLYLTVMLTLSG